jgi:hypothetical protein
MNEWKKEFYKILKVNKILKKKKIICNDDLFKQKITYSSNKQKIISLWNKRFKSRLYKFYILIEII